ncbi:hypothetical protein [Streptomyces nanshensis]|uniref:Lipoprotein n=1 Tax=Streptomyces nanshensis TaxID=518642 RepID=A0A1E7LD10_9ACTN|nr:hypothetical protein [Streptomyces nanshensis]OEV14058.1 hypothetical protein AN218_00855 [Streptomyces nanshensis]
MPNTTTSRPSRAVVLAVSTALTALALTAGCSGPDDCDGAATPSRPATSEMEPAAFTKSVGGTSGGGRSGSTGRSSKTGTSGGFLGGTHGIHHSGSHHGHHHGHSYDFDDDCDD